jgi:hypothetical protein
MEYIEYISRKTHPNVKIFANSIFYLIQATAG